MRVNSCVFGCNKNTTSSAPRETPENLLYLEVMVEKTFAQADQEIKARDQLSVEPGLEFSKILKSKF